MLTAHEAKVRKAIELAISYAINKLEQQVEENSDNPEMLEAAKEYKENFELASNELGWIYKRVEAARHYYDMFTNEQAKVEELQIRLINK